LRSQKERITAAPHQQSVWSYCCDICPLTVFIQRTDYDERIIIRFLGKERVSPEDIHVCLEAQFGNITYSKRSVRLWRQYVWHGREDLHDEVRSGTLPIDFLDIRILALLDEHAFHSASSIAEVLCVSHEPS
jgi:hypothetical protein